MFTKKMRLTNKLLMLLVSVLALGIFVSCSEKSTSDDVTIGDDGVKTIKYIFRNDSTNENVVARTDMIENGFKLLDEQLDDVTFEIEYLPKLEVDDLAMQARAGVVADIFLDEETAVGQLVEGGLIQPLDWFLELPNVEGQIFENVIDVTKYEGHLYGAPLDLAVNMVYANKNMLKELGWTDDEIATWPERVRTGEWTMDDMIETSKAAMEQGVARYGFMLDGVDNASSFTIANAFNFDMYNAEENKLVVTNDWIKVFEFWNRLVHEEKVTPVSLPSYEATYEAFYKGEFLFFTDVSGYEYWQRNSGLSQDDFAIHYEENFTQALMPSPVKGQPASVGMKVRQAFVSSEVEGEKLDYLKQALNLAYTPENQVEMVYFFGKLNTIKDTYDLEEVKDFKFIADTEYMADVARIRSAHPDYLTKYHSYYRTQVSAIIVDKVTPEAAWEKMKSEIEFNIDKDELLYN